MRFGIKSGLAFLIIGIVFLVVNYFMIQGGNYFPALLISGPLIMGLGLGFMLFKGPEPGAEVPDKDKVKHYWRGAPVMSKIMWIVFSGIGGAIGFYLMLQLDGRL